MNTDPTPDQLRICIAEACGWEPETRKMYAGVKNAKGWGKNQHLPRGNYNRDFAPYVCCLPDYLGSREAIVDAIRERFTQDEEQLEFSTQLQRIIKPHGSVVFCGVVATAEQLCLAFVRALKLEPK